MVLPRRIVQGERPCVCVIILCISVLIPDTVLHGRHMVLPERTVPRKETVNSLAYGIRTNNAHNRQRERKKRTTDEGSSRGERDAREREHFPTPPPMIRDQRRQRERERKRERENRVPNSSVMKRERVHHACFSRAPF